MQRGCRVDDYIVTIGTIVQFNSDLEDDKLVVRLVNRTSYDQGDDTCGQLYPVRVRRIFRKKQPAFFVIFAFM